jgi:hypothetical protein
MGELAMASENSKRAWAMLGASGNRENLTAMARRIWLLSIQEMHPAATMGGVSILIGNGDGTIQNATAFPAGQNPLSVVVADFTGMAGWTPL